jgi:hypothetical protein
MRLAGMKHKGVKPVNKVKNSHCNCECRELSLYVYIASGPCNFVDALVSAGVALIKFLTCYSRDSAVGIATDYGLDV